MKARTIILTGIFFLMASSMMFGQNVEKTLVKSFNLKGADVVYMDVTGDVDVQQWDKKFMRIQLTIALENSSERILKSLVEARRYGLKAKYTDHEMTVFAPGLAKDVKIKGVKLNEKIGYTVYVPKNVTVTIENGAISVSEIKNEAL